MYYPYDEQNSYNQPHTFPADFSHPPPGFISSFRQMPPTQSAGYSQPYTYSQLVEYNSFPSQPSAHANASYQPNAPQIASYQPATQPVVSYQAAAPVVASYQPATQTVAPYQVAAQTAASYQPAPQPVASHQPAVQTVSSNPPSVQTATSNQESVVITGGFNQSAIFPDTYKHMSAVNCKENGVFLSRLPLGVTESILMDVIKEYGKVHSCVLDTYSGTAAVEFENRASAELMRESPITILNQPICLAPLFVHPENSSDKSSSHCEKEVTASKENAIEGGEGDIEEDLKEDTMSRGTKNSSSNKRKIIDEDAVVLQQIRNRAIISILEDVQKAEISNPDKLIAVVVDHVTLKDKALSGKLEVIVKDIQASLSKKMVGCEVSLFGSAVMGVLMKGDPIEVSIQLNREVANQLKDKKTAISLMNTELSYDRKFGNVFGLINLREPMLVCVHKSTQFVCDLSIDDKNTTQSTSCAKISPILRLNIKMRILVIFILCWARGLKLLCKNKFSSYAIVLLVIFYLQQIEDAMVPAISSIKKQNIAEIAKTITNKDSLRKLTAGFFRYYTETNMERRVLSPYVGEKLKRSIFLEGSEVPDRLCKYADMVRNGQNLLRTDTPIVLQDPYNLCKNVTESVNASTLKDFQLFSYQALEMVTKKHLAKLLTEHIMPPENLSAPNEISSEDEKERKEVATKLPENPELPAASTSQQFDVQTKLATQKRNVETNLASRQCDVDKLDKAPSLRNDVKNKTISQCHISKPLTEAKSQMPTLIKPFQLQKREVEISFKATNYLKPKYLTPKMDKDFRIGRKGLFQRWVNVMLVILPHFLINYVRLDLEAVYDAGPQVSQEPRAKVPKFSSNVISVNSGMADKYAKMVLRKRWTCKGVPLVATWSERKNAASEIEGGQTVNLMELEALASDYLASKFSNKKNVSFYLTLYVEEEQEQIHCFFENLHKKNEIFSHLVQNLISLLPLWVKNAFESGFSLRYVTGVNVQEKKGQK